MEEVLLSKSHDVLTEGLRYNVIWKKELAYDSLCEVKKNQWFQLCTYGDFTHSPCNLNEVDFKLYAPPNICYKLHHNIGFQELVQLEDLLPLPIFMLSLMHSGTK
ncbi:hypothetical protein PoB_006224100 [Plakobranchus ocellatus]|uniref:Uncharacterized protein n=1 Tax=Plakobranchus ocellatus TaxID=259542 RepID=A0AAV4CV49_9GAST|nr:hypothetical protein PoB_006224100 [Plakobranchus ocellatus]